MIECVKQQTGSGETGRKAKQCAHCTHLTFTLPLQPDCKKKLTDVENPPKILWGEDGASEPSLLAGAEPEGGAGVGVPVLHQGCQPHGAGEPQVEGEG